MLKIQIGRFESEYRRNIFANGLLGFVMFADVISVNGLGTLFESRHQAIGTRLRIKFNKVPISTLALTMVSARDINAFVLNRREAF